MATEHVKFVSYTGKYPALCSGILTLNIDGEEVKFGWDTDDLEASEDCLIQFWRVGNGEWIIDSSELVEDYKPYVNEIATVFNANVPKPCCGGCS